MIRYYQVTFFCITNKQLKAIFSLLLFALPYFIFAQSTASFTTSGSHTWTVPACVNSIDVAVWGAGGAGGGEPNSLIAPPQAGGGGGGGAYLGSTSISVVAGTTYTIIVGKGGAGGAGDGQDGLASTATFGATVISANGGKGGKTGSNGAGGAGGTAAPGGFSGGTGKVGVNSGILIAAGYGGAGGGGAGTTANGSDGQANGTPGAGGTGNIDGAGGQGGDPNLLNALFQTSGGPGAAYGGGGGGANSALIAVSGLVGVAHGGDGADGAVIITYTVGTPGTMSSANTTTVCSGIALSFVLTASVPSTFTWIAADNVNTTGESTSIQSGNTITDNILNSSGVVQTVTYTVIPIAIQGGCAGTPQTVSVMVNPAPILSSTLTPTAICSGTSFTYNATSAVASPSFSWTRAAVSGIIEAGASGTGDVNEPSLTNTTGSSINVTYVYTTTSGTCVGNPQNVVVAVNSSSSIDLTSAAGTDTQGACSNSALANITYAIAGGATGATAVGLPSGTSGVYNSGTFTISGTPTISGVYDYTVTTTGGCNPAEAIGKLTVGVGLASAAGSDSQKVCIKTPINTITYGIAGTGAGATVAGLPSGVNSVFAAGVLTISGTPSVAGAYHYTVTATGSCAPDYTTGLITVGLGTVIQGRDTQTVCKNTPIQNIDYMIIGGDVPAPSISGLPAGVSGAVTSAGIFTISGTPSIEGHYTYSITTNGSCSSQSTLTGSITVGFGLASAIGTDTQNVCKSAAITDIIYGFAGGDVPPPTITGLPGGVSGSVTSPGVFTISGTPSVEGSYDYTITTNGSCLTQSSIGGRITVGVGLRSKGNDTQSVCRNTPIVDIVYGFAGGNIPAPSVTGLPAGVSGTISGAGLFTISGTPSVAGTFIYTITTQGSCSISSSLTGSITVGLGLINAGTNTQGVCKNSPIADISYTVLGGDVPPPSISGLPAGVSGSITSPGIFTISGTPSIEGLYTYTLSTNGSCLSQSSLTGSISVGMQLMSAPGTDTQSVCKNSPIVDIVYGFGGGDVPPPTIIGLPAGITGSITSPGIFTITGTPIVEGAFGYTLSTNGSCSSQSSLSGKITVGIGLKTTGNDTQSVCKNTPIVDIVYITFGGDMPAPLVTGLPSGVSGSITSPGVFTISGTPSVEGRFVYTVTSGGSCSTKSILGGQITVGIGLIVPGTDNQSVCKNTPITNIDYAIVGGDAPPPTIIGLPAGVSGSISAPGVFTISGTPTVEGLFTYTVSTNGTCSSQSSLSGNIAVGMKLSSAIGTDSQSVCKRSPIVDITYAFAGGDVPPPTITGLPGGVYGSLSSPGVFTISGTPTVEGYFAYVLTTHGSCLVQSSLSGKIIVGLGLVVPGTDTQSVCKNDPITDIAYVVVGGDVAPPTVNGLPAGVSGAITSAGIFTISGTPSVEGRFTYTVTSGGSCASKSSLIGQITVGLGLVVPGMDNQSVCKNTPITNIDYAIVGGDVPPPSVAGLPSGVSGSITAPGIFTISGTPTVEGLYTYTVTTNGTCGSKSSLSGNLAIGMKLSSAPGTDSQLVCKKTPITTIIYAFAGGNNPAPTIAGLPSGIKGIVTGPGIFTISGTPTVEGLYTYTLTTHGSCAVQSSLSGKIIVGLGLQVPGKNIQKICKGSSIANIDYTIVGGDIPAPIVAGLPTGVTGSISAPGVFTISGTPSVEGLYTYTVTTKGSCATQSSLTGTITVGLGFVIPGSNNQTVCKNTAITDIPVSLVGGSIPPPTVTGLPGGVKGVITAPGVFTIGGTPSVSGMFTYTVSSKGTCSTQSTITGTLTVNNASISLNSASGTDNQKICARTPITDITYTIGGTGTGATISGLPKGITSTYNAGVLTISGSPDTTSGTYIYTVSLAGSCTQTATTFTLNVVSPQAAFNNDIDSGGPPLLVNFTNNSLDATTYAWSFGDGAIDSTFNTTHTYTELGVHRVQLIASFNSQCPDTATTNIIVYKFRVPNVFTPNGDNVNDLLLIDATGIKGLDVEIYDRWGLKMMEWHDTGGAWDGHDQATGGACPAGVYYYLVKASDIDGGKYSEKGIIQLIR